MTYLVFEMRQTGIVFSSDLIVYLKINMGHEWWYTPLISVLGRQRPVDLCRLEASLVYKSSFYDCPQAIEKSCLETQKTNI